METEQRLPAAKGRESLPPDKYADDFLICYITKYIRAQLTKIKSGSRLVANQFLANDSKRYCCPKQYQELPDGNWVSIGRYHSRTVFIYERVINFNDSVSVYVEEQV